MTKFINQSGSSYRLAQIKLRFRLSTESFPSLAIFLMASTVQVMTMVIVFFIFFLTRTKSVCCWNIPFPPPPHSQKCFWQQQFQTFLSLHGIDIVYDDIIASSANPLTWIHDWTDYFQTPIKVIESNKLGYRLIAFYICYFIRNDYS